MPAAATPRRSSPRLGVTLLTAFGLAFTTSAAHAASTPVSTIVVKTKKKPTKAKARAKPTRSPAASARALVAPPAPRPRPATLPRAPAPAPRVTAPSPAPASPKVLPWITLAGSVGAGVAGAIFMNRAVSALREDVVVDEVKVSSGGVIEVPEEIQDQQRRVLTNGVIGTALLSAALTGTIASLIALN